MNAVLEETDLLSLIRKASPESRRVVLRTLIGEFMEETKYLPQPVLNSAGETVGLFVPQFRHKPSAPPQITVAEEAELHRRLKTPDNSVSAEEFIKLLELEDDRVSQRQ